MAEFNPQKHYWGSPCKRGHDGMRYNSGDCVHCAVERAGGWRKSNPEKRSRIMKGYRERNPDKCREYSRMWHRLNPEKAHQKQVRYRLNNREHANRLSRESKSRNPAANRAHCMRRYADKRGATPAWADHEEIKYVYALAGERGLSVDHIVPLRSDYVCGLHVADNLRCIPKDLNQRKSNTYWPDMPDGSL